MLFIAPCNELRYTLIGEFIAESLGFIQGILSSPRVCNAEGIFFFFVRISNQTRDYETRNLISKFHPLVLFFPSFFLCTRWFGFGEYKLVFVRIVSLRRHLKYFSYFRLFVFLFSFSRKKVLAFPTFNLSVHSCSSLFFSNFYVNYMEDLEAGCASHLSLRIIYAMQISSCC